MFKKKKDDENLKVDTSKLSKEEKEESGLKINKGLLIFCLVLLVIIIVLSIVVANIKTN